MVVYEDAKPPEVWTTTRVVTLSANVELAAGILAALVAIVGLTGEAPVWMAMVAAMLIGVGLMARGSAVGVRWRHIARHAAGSSETRAGTALEILAGVASIVFAAIAPSSSQPSTLIGSAVLVVGIALMLGGPEQTAVGELAPSEAGRSLAVTRDLIWTSSTAMVIIGLAAAVLGMLSILAGDADMGLVLVGLLGSGLGLVFAGAAMAARMMRRLA